MINSTNILYNIKFKRHALKNKIYTINNYDNMSYICFQNE